MKRLVWLLVPALAFALGATPHVRPIPRSDLNLPEYVPAGLRSPRIISEFEYWCLVKRIMPPMVLKPGFLVTQLIPARTKNAFLVIVVVSPDWQQLWMPPNVPDPETVLRDLVLRLSKHFSLAPDKMIILASCGEVQKPELPFALFDRGQSEILPPDATEEVRARLARKAEALAGPF